MAAGAATSVSIHAPLARSNGRSAARRSSVFRFQHAPLARSNTNRRNMVSLAAVSIHAPLARSNREILLLCYSYRCFNTCSSCEEQQVAYKLTHTYKVSIHAPLARSNFLPGEIPVIFFVSIHAPLARSNGTGHTDTSSTTGFNTCSSCEEQPRSSCIIIIFIKFQYMLLLRGATDFIISACLSMIVSIHAPLARSNFFASSRSALTFSVSIHAPLARSNA